MTFDDFSWSNLESNRSLIVHQLITRENEIKHAEGRGEEPQQGHDLA